MRRSLAMALALLLVSLLAACGGEKTTETKDVDLTEFYSGLETEYGWGDGYMADIEGELLENYYPGLSDISTVQLIAKAPMMSAVVSEVVLLQCETEEDAAKAAAILQERIDYQVGDETNPGGAWYPESIESWKKAQVIQQGTYVALLASAEHQEEMAKAYNDLFA
jgi:hypothetical protein